MGGIRRGENYGLTTRVCFYLDLLHCVLVICEQPIFGEDSNFAGISS